MMNKKLTFVVLGTVLSVLSGVYVDTNMKAEEQAYQEKMAPLVQKSDEIKSNFVKKQVGMVSKRYFTAIQEISMKYKEQARRNFYTVIPGNVVDPDVFYSQAYPSGEVTRRVDTINPAEYLPSDLKNMFLFNKKGYKYLVTNEGSGFIGIQQGTQLTYTRYEGYNSYGDYVGDTTFGERCTTHSIPDKTFNCKTRWSYNDSLGVLERVYQKSSGDMIALVVPARTNIGYVVSSPGRSFIVTVDPCLQKSPNFGEVLKVVYYHPQTGTWVNYFFAKGKGIVAVEEFLDESVVPRKSPVWYESVNIQYAEKYERV